MSARTPMIVGQQDARAAHRRGHVDLLHQLPAGVVAKARDVAGGIFLRVADVEAIERAVRSAPAAPAPLPGRRAGRRRDRRRRAHWLSRPRTAPIAPRRSAPCSRSCFANVQPIVPLRSATTLLATPALISDWVPMIERVRPAQLTMMVVSGSGAALAGAQHQFGAGHADRARNVHGGVFVEAANIENRDIGLARDQRGDFVRGSEGVWRRCSTSSPNALA